MAELVANSALIDALASTETHSESSHPTHIAPLFLAVATHFLQPATNTQSDQTAVPEKYSLRDNDNNIVAPPLHQAKLDEIEPLE